MLMLWGTLQLAASAKNIELRVWDCGEGRVAIAVESFVRNGTLVRVPYVGIEEARANHGYFGGFGRFTTMAKRIMAAAEIRAHRNFALPKMIPGDPLNAELRKTGVSLAGKDWGGSVLMSWEQALEFCLAIELADTFLKGDQPDDVLRKAFNEALDKVIEARRTKGKHVISGGSPPGETKRD